MNCQNGPLSRMTIPGTRTVSNYENVRPSTDKERQNSRKAGTDTDCYLRTYREIPFTLSGALS